MFLRILVFKFYFNQIFFPFITSSPSFNPVFLLMYRISSFHSLQQASLSSEPDLLKTFKKKMMSLDNIGDVIDAVSS